MVMQGLVTLMGFVLLSIDDMRRCYDTSHKLTKRNRRAKNVRISCKIKAVHHGVSCLSNIDTYLTNRLNNVRGMFEVVEWIVLVHARNTGDIIS